MAASASARRLPKGERALTRAHPSQSTQSRCTHLEDVPSFALVYRPRIVRRAFSCWVLSSETIALT